VLDLPLVTPSILAVLGAILSWLAARYWYMRAADKELRARVAELERQQGLTNLVAQPMWAAVQERLIKELTHFHTPVMDALLEVRGLRVAERMGHATYCTMFVERRTKDRS